MQFDKTAVVIRERGWLEILDLSLAMFRTRGLAILAALAAGALPCALANQWLLGEIPSGQFDEDLAGEYVLRVWLMVWLLLFEIPLATAPLTLYLGELLFVDHPQPRLIAAKLARSLPQLIIYQVVLRAVLIFFIVTWIVPFAVWPFLNEVILLERNPLVGRRVGAVSAHKRNSALHAGLSGEMFTRAIGAALIGLALTLALTMTLDFGRILLGGRGEADWWLLVVELPLALWLVVGFFAVVRFLSYLDVRIRREGWEVELGLRAEAARLERQLV